MKTTKFIRSIAVAGAFAAALSLSACDMQVSFGDPKLDPGETQEGEGVSATPDEAQTEDPVTEEAPDTSSGEDSSSSRGENAGTSDPGFDIDENGNGTIPASLLEKDIERAYSKQGTTVDKVECRNDLMIISKRGSASCNVTAYGETRYGTVKVTSVSGSNVGYSLDFPSFS